MNEIGLLKIQIAELERRLRVEQVAHARVLRVKDAKIEALSDDFMVFHEWRNRLCDLLGISRLSSNNEILKAVGSSCDDS